MQRQRQILKQKLNLSPLQIQFLNLLQIPIVDLDKRKKLLKYKDYYEKL